MILGSSSRLEVFSFRDRGVPMSERNGFLGDSLSCIIIPWSVFVLEIGGVSRRGGSLGLRSMCSGSERLELADVEDCSLLLVPIRGGSLGLG